MNYCKALVIFAVAAPVYAQYGGPAVLTRGEAPSGMSVAQIDFRPFVTISAGYDVGLNGVSVDPNGQPVNDSSAALELSAGVSGLHRWRHTQLGLNYAISASHYPGQSYYDGFNQSLMLGITHQLSRHIAFTWNTSAGLTNTNFMQNTLPQTVPFDPATTYIPTNEFFDNRTVYISTQAAMRIQKSTRLSFSMGVDGFLTRRRSTALYGVVGGGARGDVQYRLTRRSTIGAGYNYTHYQFSHVFSSTDLHNMVGSYAIQLTRAIEFSATAGVIHYETKFIQTVPVDPAVAALIGVTSTRQIAYVKSFLGSGSARFSYRMKRGVAFFGAGRSITPGNGLFLTSTSTNVNGGYAYTALRRWSINLAGSYDRSDSLANFVGGYGGYSARLAVSRQVVRYTHGVLSFDARKYVSPDFKNYNQWSYSARLGLSFSPGDLPLRLW